jgi:hypothetical protein
MNGRKNPTLEQIARRLRRAPLSHNDPRIKNDPYWALRAQGYPHSYAIRAFRDQPPINHQREASTDLGEYACDPDELLFPAGSTWVETEIAMRPAELTEEAVRNLAPRIGREYVAPDNVVKGFGVRVRESGYKCYVFVIRERPSKRQRKFTIGHVSEYSLEEARNVAKEIRREARMG